MPSNRRVVVVCFGFQFLFFVNLIIFTPFIRPVNTIHKYPCKQHTNIIHLENKMNLKYLPKPPYRPMKAYIFFMQKAAKQNAAPNRVDAASNCIKTIK